LSYECTFFCFPLYFGQRLLTYKDVMNLQVQFLHILTFL